MNGTAPTKFHFSILSQPKALEALERAGADVASSFGNKDHGMRVLAVLVPPGPKAEKALAVFEETPVTFNNKEQPVGHLRMGETRESGSHSGKTAYYAANIEVVNSMGPLTEHYGEIERLLRQFQGLGAGGHGK